jgi:MFS family permease
MALRNDEQLDLPVQQAPRSVNRRQLHGWAVTIWLLIMLIISWADKGVIGLAAVPIMRDLHLSSGEFGLIGSSVFFLFGISTVVVGLVANRVQARWVLAVLVVLWSVAQAPVLLVGVLPALLGSRILLGAAEGPTTPLAIHAIAKWFPDRERSLPVGISNTGASLGLAIAAPVLTFFIVNYGWRSALLVLAVAGVIWTLVWLVIGREGPFTRWAQTMGSDTTTSGAAESLADAPEPRVPYRKLLGSGTWLGGLVVGFVCYWTISMSASWLPAYLQKGLHYSARTAGNLAGLPPLLGVVAVVLFTAASGWLLRRGVSTRWGRGVFAGGVTVVSGVCMVLLPFVPAGAPLMVLVILAFGLPLSALPLGVLALAEMAPVRQRAAVLSFSTAVGTLAGVIAPAASGALIGAADAPPAGYGHALMLAAVLMIVGGLLGAVFVRPQRDAHRFGLTASRATIPSTASAKEPSPATGTETE